MNKAFSGIICGIRAVCDLILPTYCIGCKIRGEILCISCIRNLRTVDRPTDSWIHAVFDYRDPVIKKAIWELKYHNRKTVGSILGIQLQENLIEKVQQVYVSECREKIIVLPVPISNHKRRIRGYNQTEIIARAFCESNEYTQLETTILIKNKDTIAQARISNRTSRLENIRDVFSIKSKEKIYKRIVIVIDDVVTTGGTFTEIKRVLKNNGAHKVICFAVAH